MPVHGFLTGGEHIKFRLYKGFRHRNRACKIRRNSPVSDYQIVKEPPAALGAVCTHSADACHFRRRSRTRRRQGNRRAKVNKISLHSAYHSRTDTYPTYTYHLDASRASKVPQIVSHPLCEEGFQVRQNAELFGQHRLAAVEKPAAVWGAPRFKHDLRNVGHE
jgi:hypothetical protein